MTDLDRTAISDAVHAAEAGTSGEIVTIIADRSDAYHDVGLHYAILAALLIPLASAIYPGGIGWLHTKFSGGWATGHDEPGHYLMLFVVMTVTFLIIRYALAWMPLRLALTPGATKQRRVRRRAVDLFKVGTEARTAGRTGILIYLSMGERRAEIVADAAIHGAVNDGAWGDAMVAMIAEVREGRVSVGMVAAVNAVGVILAAHLPRADDDVDELPDRVIEL